MRERRKTNEYQLESHTRCTQSRREGYGAKQVDDSRRRGDPRLDRDGRTCGKGGAKAQTAIFKVKHEIYKENTEDYASPGEVKLTLVDTVKETWQYYIPAVLMGTASSAAIIYAHKIDLTKLTSIMGTYQLTKNELKQLKDKIIQKDGEEKLREYEKDVHKDTLNQVDAKTIVDTGKGTTIFYEPLTDTLFYSDIWHVERALIRMVEECT